MEELFTVYLKHYDGSPSKIVLRTHRWAEIDLPFEKDKAEVLNEVLARFGKALDRIYED